MSMNYDIMKTIAGFCKSHQIDPEDGAELYECIVTDLQWNWDDEDNEDERRQSFLKVYEKTS